MALIQISDPNDNITVEKKFSVGIDFLPQTLLLQKV